MHNGRKNIRYYEINSRVFRNLKACEGREGERREKEKDKREREKMVARQIILKYRPLTEKFVRQFPDPMVYIIGFLVWLFRLCSLLLFSLRNDSLNKCRIIFTGIQVTSYKLVCICCIYDAICT